MEAESVSTTVSEMENEIKGAPAEIIEIMPDPEGGDNSEFVQEIQTKVVDEPELGVEDVVQSLQSLETGVTQSGVNDDGCCEFKENSCTAETDGKVSDVTLLNNKLQTIKTYQTLAEHKKTHHLLLNDATVSGFLVLCLGDEDPEIVETSFQVFVVLSQSPENLQSLQTLSYCMEGLRCVVMNERVSEDVRTAAKKLISEIKRSACGRPHRPLSELSASDQNVIAASSNTKVATTVDENGLGKASASNPPDLNTTMSTMKRKNKGRETVLYIADDIIQQKQERSRITQVLIGVQGIISVTYDLKKNHCIIRGKRTVPSENFARAVAALSLADVYIVRKNENKEEVKICIPATDKENTMYPPYPEDQENDDLDGSRMLAKNNQQPADDTSFFKSAKNFIKRSFYW